MNALLVAGILCGSASAGTALATVAFEVAGWKCARWGFPLAIALYAAGCLLVLAGVVS